MKKKILVTGGTGYIGSHTTVELINEGYDVIIADNLSNSDSHTLNRIESITGVKPAFAELDFKDKTATEVFFNKNKDIEAVIHFAAYKAVGESVENPLKYYENNLFSMINVLKSMKEHNINSFVFSSSCTVYGQPDKLPVDENAPIKKANSPYGNTKQICEEILMDLINSSDNLNAISLRYFNPIGAHPSGKMGELPGGIPDNLVPFITQTAAGLRKQLSVFGDDYDTRDGSCIRDYIDIMDLAKAHVKSIKRLLQKNNKENFEVFNLGTGNGVTVFEIINAFEESTGIKLNYKVTDRRAGDVEKVYADTVKAKKELGWIAETELNKTMLSAWKWEDNYRKNQK